MDGKEVDTVYEPTDEGMMITDGKRGLTGLFPWNDVFEDEALNEVAT